MDRRERKLEVPPPPAPPSERELPALDSLGSAPSGTAAGGGAPNGDTPAWSWAGWLWGWVMVRRARAQAVQ